MKIFKCIALVNCFDIKRGGILIVWDIHMLTTMSLLISK